jgi:hypothetical protein
MAMRKIRLDLDDLSVESFDVTGDREEGGTVLGRESEVTDIHYYTCHANTCAYYVTCPGYKHDVTCDDSCDPYAATCAVQCG